MGVTKITTLATLLFSGALAQTDYISKVPSFSPDTMYIGSEFARPVAGTVRVWLKGNSALFEGSLYLIHPVTKAEIFLFKNKNNGAASTNIDITATVALVPLNTPITFMYNVSGDKFYTGPNIPGISAFVTAYSSYTHPNPDKRYGRRFSAVGKSKTSGVLDGNLEFGFEDNKDMSWSDMDYNDIIFGVSGLVRGITTRTLASKGFVW